MPSYLEDYPGSRTNADQKFIRAVNSFKAQTLEHKELIIVSDGCDITNKIYFDNWQQDSEIKLIRVEKQKGWPGKLRECARCFATYDWICYLDSDDMLSNYHLTSILNFINDNKVQENQILTTYKYTFPIKDGIVTDSHSNIIGYNKEVIQEYLGPLRTCPPPYELKSFSAVVPVLKQLNGTWQIVHHNKCKTRWTSLLSSQGGEDKQFIHDLLKECQEVKSNHNGYIVCHHADRQNIKSINLVDF
jgi:glycosyltransferase involved in cell wall biosynthesis